MPRMVVPLSAPEASVPSRFGAKAANLAALAQAGLPVPEGFCVDAQAYRIQLIASGAVDVSGFITAKDPLTDSAASFEEYERNPSRILRIVIDSGS